MTLVVEVEGLTKTYGPLTAVDHISFKVQTGEVFALLGPNGAGKTTTIRMLTGLTRPTSGRARVLGLDLARELPRIKKQIGVVPEQSNLYDELTARDNLLFVASLYGVPRRERGLRADELLRRFRLEEKRGAFFARLSRGMKRALTVAAALIHHPRLLFLDEPTVGLDVVSAHGLRALVGRLREEGVTVFLTTHYLEEAERLADRVALLVRGRIVALDTVEGLKAHVKQRAAVEMYLTSAMGQERLRFHGESVEAALHAAMTHAEAEGKRVMTVNTLQPTLEDAFIQLTGLSAEMMQVEKEGR